MAAIYSVLNQGRMMVWIGTLANLQADGRIWKKNSLIAPSDLPGTVYIGDGVSTFTQLSSLGKTKRPVATAINTTGAGTSSALLDAIYKGRITSTSAAAVTLTMPIATALATKFGGVGGVSLEFTVDNVSGASTVTLAVSTGVTIQTAVITGADNVAVLSGKVGIFRLLFTSATAVLLSRVA
jgi:hypothetical protein